jgi:hypothetical protein
MPSLMSMGTVSNSLLFLHPEQSLIADEHLLLLLEVTDVSEVHNASIIRAIIALRIEAVHTSQTSVHCNKTTQCCFPEDSHLLTRCHEIYSMSGFATIDLCLILMNICQWSVQNNNEHIWQICVLFWNTPLHSYYRY